jgi:hypothetical protein
MNHLYEARNLSNQKLPWIKVRIKKLKCDDALGCALAIKNEINISEDMGSWNDLTTKYVVFHELCHKYFGGKHTEKGLMAPVIQDLSEGEIIKDFKKCAGVI